MSHNPTLLQPPEGPISLAPILSQGLYCPLIPCYAMRALCLVLLIWLAGSVPAPLCFGLLLREPCALSLDSALAGAAPWHHPSMLQLVLSSALLIVAP